MNTLSLDGPWKVRRKGESVPIPATAPGCIHTDLLAAGVIEDPFFADNEKRYMWIGETDWIYERAFTLEDAFLDAARIDLVCRGLDTLAGIKVNGRTVGKTDNAFRVWRFDLTKSLRSGENTIEITFASTIPYITRAQKRRYLTASGVGHHRIDGSNQIRKSQCNYGWDWGPMCVTCGIWRSIGLEAIETARIASVEIRQDHRRRDSVAIDVSATVERMDNASVKARLTVLFDGTVIERAHIPLVDALGAARIRIPDPKLWWPNGLGDQPLYEVVVELFDANERLLDTWRRSVGLRRLALERKPDRWGESFRFVVNGKPFFAKGANWIPADAFVTRLDYGDYERLIRSAAEANMNMLRVWGGGIYEADEFYDLCDRYGICIWQDFMFACSAYPAYDNDYLDSVKAEAEDTIRRIRHHPSLALWCGNNEIEQMHTTLIGDGEGRMTWAEYSRLFDGLLPELIAKLDPERPYWPSSPHTPGENRADFNNPDSGDAHLWQVWHGRQPFEWYRTCDHRFNSEFGFQSFPEPRVVEKYTPKDERNITSYIMELHQRSGIGNDAIMQYMLSWFRHPDGFEKTLWLSQILQGLAIKYAVEHWRRRMPRAMGTLYWQINDCWPVASWSSIDYDGNWKALHYMAKRFYAPLLLSAVEDVDSKKVAVYVTNDHREPRQGVVRRRLIHTDGRTLAAGEIEAKVGALKSGRVGTIDLAAAVDEYGERNLLLSLTLDCAGKRASDNLITFVRPKHLTLGRPKIRASIRTARDGYLVTLRSDVPALWVWLELPGKATYSDRFAHLMPGESMTIRVTPEKPMRKERFERSLRIRSLRDTYE